MGVYGAGCGGNGVGWITKGHEGGTKGHEATPPTWEVVGKGFVVLRGREGMGEVSCFS